MDGDKKKSFIILKIAGGVIIILIGFVSWHFIQRGMAVKAHDQITQPREEDKTSKPEMINAGGETRRVEEAGKNEELRECIAQSRQILLPLMKYYRRGQWKDGLECLASVKQKFSEFTPFPIDELKGLNEEFNANEGMYLGTLAEKLLTTCKVCGGKGKVDCPRCWTIDNMGPGPKGKIKVVVGRDTQGKEVTDWVACPMCRGDKSVKCGCSARREYREFQAIKKFFMELQKK